MKKKLRLVLFVLLTGLLVSCGQNEKNKEANKEEQKDRLILAIGGEPDNGFDPTTGWGQYASPLFQSTLLKYDKDFNIFTDSSGYPLVLPSVYNAYS